MSNTSKFWNTDKIISLTAVIVSVSALFISVMQTRIMREQQYTSVYPYIEWGNSTDRNVEDSTGRMEMYVGNNGIGPAMIKDVKIICNGKTYEEYQLDDVFYAIAPDSVKARMYMFSTVNKRMMPANEKILMFKLHDKNYAYHFANKYFEAMSAGKFDIEITYSDMYDNTWKVKNREHIRVK